MTLTKRKMYGDSKDFQDCQELDAGARSLNLEHRTLLFMPKNRVIPICLMFLLLIMGADPAICDRGYTERDYMVDRHQRFQGYEPVLFDGHTISVHDSKWHQTFGYVMSKDRALLLKVQPVTQTAGVIMFASQAGSPRCMQAVWARDNITEPIRVWTDQYWISDKRCNATGCPKIMFKATQGTLEVIILKRRR